jgi:hypothetical protein
MRGPDSSFMSTYVACNVSVILVLRSASVIPLEAGSVGSAMAA